MERALLFGLVAFGALWGIWFGYPLVMFAVSKLAARPCRPVSGYRPRITIILATRDDVASIERRVANLKDTDYPQSLLEIIVAVDSNAPRVASDEFSGFQGNVRCLRGDTGGGKATALNVAVRHATGEILVMADAKQDFSRETIGVLVEALGDSRFGAVSGALELGGSRSDWSPIQMYWRLEKGLRFHEAQVHSSIGVTGAVYAARRELFPLLPVGTILDDVFVPMRIVLGGKRVGFARNAVARDVREFDARAEGARKERTLTGVVQLCRLMPELLSPRRNPLWLQFVLHKLARLLTPLLFSAMLISVFNAAMLLAIRSGPIASATAGILAVVAMSIPRVRTLIVGLAKWLWIAQSSTSKAVWNSVVGRWQVWHGPR